MADNYNGGWSVNNDQVIIDGDQQNTEPVNRDNLVLHRINENGTIGEMVDTINENFKNIAMHGGGPAGMDGINGFDGVDGTNVEYIYALSDEMEAGTHYPTDSGRLRELFEKCDMYHSHRFNNVTWYDHAQPISKDHPNEYVFSRFRRTNDESSPWYYAEEPVLWAHWGETGRDGDGVEYIFRIYDHELTDDECRNAFSYMDSMDNEMKAIYNIDDFYPGATWFNATNKSKAEKALKKAGLYSSDSNFDTRWTAKFNFCDNGSWTDDPTGTGYGKPYEYVSVRRSNVDEETDKKEWSKYSEPALWSKYSFEGRIFIIYANLPIDQKPTAENGLAPKKGDGWWDVQNDKLIFTSLNGSGTIPSIWTDTNIDPEDGEYAWMCSGIFDHTGKNISWSNPTCISGKDGQPGEDGSMVEFIYALTNDPDYPNPLTNKTAADDLFEAIENATRDADGNKSHQYGDTVWFDNAQPISPLNPTEYMWSRTKVGKDDYGNYIWEYTLQPVIWAHWGEDGTDGDGVEYIFHLSNSSNFPDAAVPVKLAEMESNPYAPYLKLIFNMNDFYPGNDWFDKTKKNDPTVFINRDKVREKVQELEALDSSFSVTYFDAHWNDFKQTLDRGWTDNPQGTGPMNPYEFVSIRRCDPDATPRAWGDFSEPAQWSYYGKATRVFMVYCNMAVGVTPMKPRGGWWNVGGNPELVKSRDELTKYTYNALPSGTPDYTSHVGYWEDDNEDVDDTIAWSSTAVFAEDGNIVVDWSKPHRLTGEPGKPGEDGAGIEFIYAVEDSMEAGKNYPVKVRKDSESDDTYTQEDLFNEVENSPLVPKRKEYRGTNGTMTTWFDNAQAIDKAHRTVYAWSRHKDSGLDQPWDYDPEPFIWSHWGEDGKDGDGIEYIFLTADHNTIQSDELPVVGSTLTGVQKVIYNIDDFYPGPNWFTDGTQNTKDNKSAARVALEKANMYDSSTFDSSWTNKFGFTFVEGDNGSHWTDNPSGISVHNRFEFVSIRKSNYDANGNKVWGDYSNPVLWSSYGKATRTFLVYCNTITENAPATPHDGWWNTTGNRLSQSEEISDDFCQDVLTANEREAVEQHEVYGDYADNIGWWKDDDIDVRNTITWISTGVFDESGENLSWSEPHRITGANGQKGADGSDIQFIYTLSDDPAYPGSVALRNDLFSAVEDPDHASEYGYTAGIDSNNVKFIDYNGTHWYDRAQLISRQNKIEYCASRKLPAGATESTPWSPDAAPFVWAHWGEDGTDGDGIEYIFLPNTEAFDIDLDDWTRNVSIENLSIFERGIYSLDDLIPYSGWFDNNQNICKPEVRKYVEAEGTTFTDAEYNTAWASMRSKFSFDLIAVGQKTMGHWYDNPQNVTPSSPYQYVSVRKSPDGVWGTYSYPTLWSKYNVAQFTTMVFTKAKVDVKLENASVSGGRFNNPYPDDTTYEGTTYEWKDGPDPTAKDEVIWMTSAVFREDYPNGRYVEWSAPQRMSDRSDFNVEWSESDLTVGEVVLLNRMLDNSAYNFGTFLQGHTEAEAETLWRNKVKTDSANYSGISVGVDFDDDPGQAVLMATCQLTNGVWSNWKVVRVKGETGPEGRSIKVTDRIDHEVYLEQGVTYNWQNVQDALVNPTLERTPVEGDFLIVYPDSVNSDDIYWGDISNSRGGALYMFKYVNGIWTDYSNYDGNTPNGEDIGNSYGSPNKHLILWDGDSWQDLGELTGPEGPAGRSWAIYTRYANDDFSQTAKACHKKFVTSTEDIPYAKWVGFITYEVTDVSNPEEDYDEDDYTWSLFKGQDGYGYEYIFWANNDINNPPRVPPTNSQQDATDDVKPNDNGRQWSDNPIEPTLSNRYVWMCWRKHDGVNGGTSVGCWGKFRGANGDLSTEENAKAKLWQVYANTITRIDEYFHADENINPSGALISVPFTSLQSNLPDGWSTFWYPKSQVVGDNATASIKWCADRPYLFNREVITYSDGSMNILDSHFISVWAKGIKDVIDYYCLEAPTEDNDYDPGDEPPAMLNNNLPKIPRLTYISGSGNYDGEEGIDYWTTDVTKTKLSTEYPVLWNVTYKVFEDNLDSNGLPIFNYPDGRTAFTTPLVVGVYGEGTNGTDSVYVDLDNEMDALQISEDNNTLYNRDDLVTNVKLYKGDGDVSMKIHDIDISGEEAIVSSYTFEYYKDNDITDDTDDVLLGSVTFNGTWSNGRYNYTASGTDIMGTSQEIDRVKITFTVPKNKKLVNKSCKIVISVTNKVSEILSTTRKTSYTLVGMTDKSIYSIVLDENKLLERVTDGVKSIYPSNMFMYVVERCGSETTTHRHNNISNTTTSYKLQAYVNNDTSPSIVFGDNDTYELNFLHTTSSETPASGVTTIRLQEGSKITFELLIKPVGGSWGLMDRETLYVIKEGTDGTPGAAGNGYEYRYARYKENGGSAYPSTVCNISTSQQASSVSNPKVHFGNSTTAISTYPEMSGVDATYTYEYRIERTIASTAGSWSTPKLIGKYLTASGISGEVESIINSIVSDQSSVLGGAVNRVNTLSGYFDSNGVLKEDSFPTGILSGYIDQNLNAKIAGVQASDAELSTFADWVDYEHGRITSVGASYEALSGQLTNYATQAELSEVTSAIDTFKVDAHDKFASMDRTVANTSYITDPEGVLMVNVPDYVTWFNTEGDMSTNKSGVEADERRNVEWVLFKNGSYFTTAPYKANGSSTGLSTLYDENSKNKTIALELYVPKSSVSQTGINSIKTTLSNVTVAVSLSGDGSPVSYSIASNPTSLSVGVITNSNPGTNQVKLVAYTNVSLDYNSNQSDPHNYTFTSLSWEVGAVSVGTNVSDVSFAYTKMASTDDKPWLVSNSNLDVFDNLTMNSIYGYTIKKDENNVNVPAETYGTLDITSQEGYDFKLLPAAGISVSDVVNYLTGTGTTTISASSWISSDKNIPYNTESKEYYVACSYSSGNLPNGPVSYAVELSDSGITNSSNTVNFISTGISDLIDNSISVSMSRIANAGTYYHNNGGIYSTIAVNNSTVTLSLSTMGASGNQRDIVDAFSIATDYINSQVNLSLSYVTNSGNENINYLILPSLYTSATLSNLNDAFKTYISINTSTYNSTKSFYETTEDDNASFYFLNNPAFGTNSIYEWKNISDNGAITVNFNNAYKSGSMYYLTVVVRRNLSSTAGTPGTVTVNMTATKANNMVWDTLYKTRVINYPFKSYLLDKISVTIKDRSVSDTFKDNRKQATGQPTSYLSVSEDERPYLIPVVTELATISQTVSDGIASTMIVTQAGEDARAVFFAQAVEGGGSQIYMNANEVGIESDYFKLDNNGLSMKGNLYAMDSDGNITAGVIGEDNPGMGDIKFFAGTSVKSENALQNAIKSAPFRVYEDGHVVANDIEILSDTGLHSSNIHHFDIEVDEGDGTANAGTGYSFSDGNYTGDISLDTIVNSNGLSIVGNGVFYKEDDTDSFDISGNRLYIRIIPRLSNPNYGENDKPLNDKQYLYGVPALCMNYMGEEFILSPGSWYNPNVVENTSNIRWISDKIVYVYTFDGSGMNSLNGYSSNISGSQTLQYLTETAGNYYIFNDTYSPSFISGNENNLYRLYISFGNLQGTAKSETAAYITSNNLASVSENYAITSPAKVLVNRIPESYRGISNDFYTNITNDICVRYKGYIPASATMADILNYNYTYNSTQIITLDGTVAENIYGFIKKLITPNNTTPSYYWHEYNSSNYLYVNGLYSYLPFDTNDVCYSRYVKLNIDYYPVFTITNGTNISESSDMVYCKFNFEMNGNYNYNDRYAQFYIGGDSSYTNQNYYASQFNCTLNFEYVLKFNSPVDKSDIRDKVTSFISKFNFQNLSNEHIKFEAHLVGRTSGGSTITLIKTNIN